MVLPENENMEKGGYGGHASKQTPAIIESPVIYKYSTPTNADRIRAMNDEELAKFLCSLVSPPNKAVNCGTCLADEYCRMGHTGFIDWLGEEVRE